MSDRFLIKLRGTVVGEVTANELRSQVHRGQIGPLHKISSDGGTSWKYASEFEDLFGAVANPNTAPATDDGEPPVLAQAIDEWHVTCGPDQLGPVSIDAIRDLISEERVQPSDKIWRDGFESWQPIETVFRTEMNRVSKRKQKEERQRQRELKRKARPVIPPEEQSFSFLAVTSFVMSILWIFGVASVGAVILSCCAFYEIGSSGGYLKGWVFAILGFLLGILGSALGAILFLL